MPQFDKLAFMNRALRRTGNNTVTTDDSSDEYQHASDAFDSVFPLILYDQNWNFQTAIDATLARVSDSAYPGFGDVYAKPGDCLFLMNAWRADLTQWVGPGIALGPGSEGVRPPPLDYQVIGDQIHCTAPCGLACEYVRAENDATDYPPGFIEAVGREMESVLYQSLNEDLDSAVATKKLAEAQMQRAAARNSAEGPRKVLLRSTLTERRRTRTFSGWS